jgi:hypothetical protein
MNEMAAAAIAAPEVEREVATDLVRRGLKAAPVLLVLDLIFWGTDGILSGAFAVLLVMANFALSAAILSWAAKIGPTMLMGATLGGYILRLGLVTAAVVAVHEQPWVAMPALGITLVVTHLGLLFWETRHVSMSLAYPGLAPRREGS